MKKYILIILILNILSTKSAFSLIPIVPENVLSKDEIDEIVSSEDYFFSSTMDETSPAWKNTNRRYGSHLLGDRTSYFTLDEIIHRTITDGFPIQYKIEELYRAKLGIHSKVGKLLPNINFAFGEGALGLGVENVFAGIFGFLLPSNWLKLANQSILYSASKNILAKSLLDQILSAKLQYLVQHQRIQEFEIFNFYFIHLQLLARMYPNENRATNTLLGRFAVQGTDMASLRGETKLGFDDLARFMALDKIGDDYTVQSLNIADLNNFPEKVPDTKDIEEQYRHKDKFLESVIEKSVELKIVKDFFEISKLNIGITAFGGIFSNVDRPANADMDARFAFKFGYDTLPNILISKSQKNTAKIDVSHEYLKILDTARRSYDYYTNSLGGFTEAKRSLRMNRKAFKQNLAYLVETKNEPDSLFILSLNQLIQSELKLNNALHGFITAKAYMDRFLLNGDMNVINYLPKKGKVLKCFKRLIDADYDQTQKEKVADKFLRKVKRSLELNSYLYGMTLLKEEENLSDEDVLDSIKRNIGNLLYSKWNFYKSKKFYNALKDYIDEHNIELTFQESALLNKKIGSLIQRNSATYVINREELHPSNSKK